MPTGTSPLVSGAGSKMGMGGTDERRLIISNVWTLAWISVPSGRRSVMGAPERITGTVGMDTEPLE